MTAEIAILNKSAVVLAADSAVTISSGSSQEKIFDSEDKLFELSDKNHIGVMVNGDLDFMQTPLSVLIKRYRKKAGKYKRVATGASRFLRYLSDFGAEAPEVVKKALVRHTVRGQFEEIKDRVENLYVQRIVDSESSEVYREIEDFGERARVIRKDLFSEMISVLEVWVSRFPDAEFVGAGSLEFTACDLEGIAEEREFQLGGLEPDQAARVDELGKAILMKAGFGSSTTGLIFAGYGSEDLFPTLVPFTIHGIVGDRLKFVRGEQIDIDRGGEKARVVPFAQREMVERFLYGIDEQIVRSISAFTKEGISEIKKAILDSLDISVEDKALLEQDAGAAEFAFMKGLGEKGFDAIRRKSRSEIEGMVEFMPKAEMAKMAEALVNLTSIKRRVSVGMETVGGPIDVAVISQSEGFVWVKRKHYFSADLNHRFFERMRNGSK